MRFTLPVVVSCLWAAASCGYFWAAESVCPSGASATQRGSGVCTCTVLVRFPRATGNKQVTGTSVIQGCVGQLHLGGVAVAGLSSEDLLLGREAGEPSSPVSMGDRDQTKCDLPGAARGTPGNRGRVLSPESSSTTHGGQDMETPNVLRWVVA